LEATTDSDDDENLQVDRLKELGTPVTMETAAQVDPALLDGKVEETQSRVSRYIKKGLAEAKATAAAKEKQQEEASLKEVEPRFP